MIENLKILQKLSIRFMLFRCFRSSILRHLERISSRLQRNWRSRVISSLPLHRRLGLMRRVPVDTCSINHQNCVLLKLLCKYFTAWFNAILVLVIQGTRTLSLEFCRNYFIMRLFIMFRSRPCNFYFVFSPSLLYCFLPSLCLN